MQHTERHLAIYTAHNVDGTTTIDEGAIPRVDRFRMDPQIDNDLQIDNERGYLNNPWDRGHLVRRESMHWGDFDTAVAADLETFFWTNIAPQHEDLHDDSWGHIERWLLDRIEGAPRRACIFTGPIFGLDDPPIHNAPGELEFLLPAGYWKVGAITTSAGLKAVAFIAWHRDFGNSVPGDFIPTLDQVRVTTVEHLTGLDFQQLRTVDPLLPEPTPSLAARMRKQPGRILGAGDIVL